MHTVLDGRTDGKAIDFRGQVIVAPDGYGKRLTLLVDGLADTERVVPCDEQKEVDQANLRKFGPGSYERDDGKWIKPPDWTPPDILGVLERQAKGA